tara:strand:+ start:962 stop:1501 length:540 start_codon:yes stop_codon:yes gene_type:complete
MYLIVIGQPTGVRVIQSDNPLMSIPLDPANRDYQRVLDDIIEQGADCFEGDIPEDLQVAADAKQFAQQVVAYTAATARIAQYQLSVGREEVVESQPTGEQVYNEETFEMEDVMADVITQTAIEPLEATVEVTVYGDDPEAEPTVETVTNPLIVTDVEERTAAQAVIDATPTEVIQHVEA